MLTLKDIRDAHAKVKSGADFPRYINDLRTIGVKSYDTFVSDGHTLFIGINDSTLLAPQKYPAIEICPVTNTTLFESYLNRIELILSIDKNHLSERVTESQQLWSDNISLTNGAYKS